MYQGFQDFFDKSLKIFSDMFENYMKQVEKAFSGFHFTNPLFYSEKQNESNKNAKIQTEKQVTEKKPVETKRKNP
ncbi:MAG TPA: hypothetical protein DHW82_04760 [Spirochaetia bacterium]|nr:MAG: hypothetical protein A2Y41_08600 [Spirochaetes bacterium GWB1_36_13]HCL56305.1 hypothetical protein [Spirochaetia bacterium]